jgi:hypothetical protein
MAVNYGLGGFKDGAGFIYATAPETEVTISTQDVETLCDVEYDILDSLNASQPSVSVLSLNLAGYWLVNYNVSTSGASGDDLTFGIATEGSAAFSPGQQKFNSKAGDYWTTSGWLIIKILSTSEPTITLVVSNNSGTDNITLTDVNISAFRIGSLDGTGDYEAGIAFANVYQNSSFNVGYAATDTFYPLGEDLVVGNVFQVGFDNRKFTIEQPGFYYFAGSFSVSGSANDDLELGVFINGTNAEDVQTSPKQAWNAKGGSVYQTSYNGLFQLKKGDTLEPCVQNITDTTGNSAFQNTNLVLIRVGNI